MKKFTLFIICIFFFTSSFSQITFQKVINGSYESQASAVIQTSDNGYVIAGYTRETISDNLDLYLIKTNEEGSILWTKTIAGIGDVEANDIEQTNDGGFIIAGTSTDTADNADLFLVKTNSSGDTVWTKAFNGISTVMGNSVQQTFDGGYIVAGWTDSYGVGGNDFYLIKTDENGDTTWTQTYGGAGNEAGNCVKQTSDSGYIIVGYTLDFGQGNANVYLVKTDAKGTVLWTKTYGGAFNNIGYSVQQTADKGYIITGETNSFGGGDYDVYLIKTNSTGDTLWTRTYGGIYDDGANEVHQTTDGGYIIAGTANSVADTLDDVYLIRTNADGDTLWTKTFGGSHADDGFSAQQTKDGGFIISGFSKSFLAPQNYKAAYLIKTDSSGNSGCYQGNLTTVVRATGTITGGSLTLTSFGSNSTPTLAAIGSIGYDSTLCLNITGIDEQEDNSGLISVYPDPAIDRINIKNIPLAGKVAVDIYNILGEDLLSFFPQVAGWDGSMNIKNLASGIYIVRVTGDKQQWVSRFIKN